MPEHTDFPTPTMLPVNGIELEVFEAGRENIGNPIILCHGWPELAYSWRYQIPALVKAGYHVIIPNQRGYGNSSCPKEVTRYDIDHLTADLVALLDHYGYQNAIFCGHDWGANLVWCLALLHPDRVTKIISLALPYQVRTEVPWIEFLETCFGPDHYFVHFNRQPGVAEAVMDKNVSRFFRNFFRKEIGQMPPAPGMMMINLALENEPSGSPLMTGEELAVFVAAFEKTGFKSSIDWYRNLDRNWQILADIDPVIQHPSLMIYGDQDLIPKSATLRDYVPNVGQVSLDCGHWIQQEKPDETTHVILNWLAKQKAQ